MATKKAAKKTKKAVRKRRKTAPKTTPASPPAEREASGVKVRMYRQGFGDCFLITLPRQDDSPFYVLIDCGVLLGTKDPVKTMTKVVEDIRETTGRHIDILVATHEHWDHLSGFIQARELFKSFTVGEVWVAWTEDDKDPLAKKLAGERQSLAAALTIAANRMRLAGAPDAANEIHGLLEFFGAAGRTTKDALKFVHEMSDKVRYCLPSDDPVELGNTGVRAYVLGPPHDEKLIKKYRPSKKEPETYGIDSMNLFMSAMDGALHDVEPPGPFDAVYRIPMEAAKQMLFFQEHYWGEDEGSDEKDQSWRAIDADWLSSSTTLALHLDSATNNTSLVIALELANGEVLLFAADAQVGNWLSWQNLEWDVNHQKVTGIELLSRTSLYKVGHHGSHNATLRDKGLELMSSLKVALLPVDQAVAKKMGWDRIPLTELVDRLAEVTNGGVLRADDQIPAALKGRVTGTDLFYEMSF